MSLYDSKQKIKAFAFVAGAIYWSITIFCITLVQHQNGNLFFIGLMLGVASIGYLSPKGWGWHSEWGFGTVGGTIKFFVILFLSIPILIFGTSYSSNWIRIEMIIPLAILIIIVYWTGKGILKSIGYVESDFQR